MEEVEPGSDEFIRVKYLVDLSLPQSLHNHISGLSILSFRNHNTKKDFEYYISTHSQNGDANINSGQKEAFNTLTCWYDLKGEQPGFSSPVFGEGGFGVDNPLGGIESVVQKINDYNLSLPDDGNGLRFFAGKYNKNDVKLKKRVNIALCQVAVGRSFVVDDISELKSESPVPEGFHSLYLALQSANNETDDISSDDVDYRHNYSVFDTRQVLPLYFVSFYLDERDQSLRKAESNETSEEEIYNKCNFFDPLIYRPVSVKDKMVGSHASGPYASHKLIKIEDAFNSALFESNKDDEDLKFKLKEIRSELSNIDEKLNQVNNNAAKVEELIYETLQDALFYLQDETQNKLNKLLSEEVELRRKMQQVIWMQQNLHTSKATANMKPSVESKVDFLNGWKCFCLLKNDICKTPLGTAKLLDSVHADMELVGGIEVMSARQIAMRQRSQRSPRKSRQPHPSKTTRNSRSDQFGFPVETQNNVQARSIPTHLASPQQQQDHQEHEQEQKYSPKPQTMLQPVQTARTGQPASIPNGFSASDINKIPPHLLPQVLKNLNLSPGSSGNLNDYLMKLARSGEDCQSVGKGSVHAPPTPDVLKFSRKVILDVTPPRLGAYSLHAESIRKMRQMKMTCEDAFDASEKMFQDSRLISTSQRVDLDEFVAEATSVHNEKMKRNPPKSKKDEPEIEVALKVFSQAQSLAFCLPIFSSTQLPETKLLFASWLSSKGDLNIKQIIDAIPLEEVDIEDEEGNHLGIEKLPPTNFSTLLIIRSGKMVFGAFIDDALKSKTNPENPEDGAVYGSNQCFLFSISLDIKIPFHGAQMLKRSDQAAFNRGIVEDRMNEMKKKMRKNSNRGRNSKLRRDDESEENSDADSEDENNGPKMGAILSNDNKIQIGVRDLWLTSNLKQCGSQLEHTFGAGLRRNTEEANTLLAGKMIFDVDEIEVWGLQE